MKFDHSLSCLLVLILYGFTLISAFPTTHCPTTIPIAKTCGANFVCANNACCSSSGTCGTTPEYCGCGCQSGRCLIPSLILSNPPTTLIAGANTSIRFLFTSPFISRILIDLVQKGTNNVIGRAFGTISSANPNTNVSISFGWWNTTNTGINGFYFHAFLVNATLYDADHSNAWRYPMAEDQSNDITILPSPTTSTPTTSTPTPTPTAINDITDAPITTDVPTSTPTPTTTTTPTSTTTPSTSSTTTPTPTITSSPPTNTPTSTSAPTSTPTSTPTPTTPSSTSKPTSTPTSTSTSTPTPASTTPTDTPTSMNPSTARPSRICPAVGNDETWICQGCGYTKCRDGIAIYYNCPSGTCNPFTDFCDTSVTCGVDGITPIGATPPPERVATVNHATISSISYHIMIGMMGMMMWWI